MNAYRFICHSYHSSRDINGNVYHLARIVDCQSGQQISFYADFDRHASHLIAKALGINQGWYEVSETMGKREFDRLQKASFPVIQEAVILDWIKRFAKEHAE